MTSGKLRAAAAAAVAIILGTGTLLLGTAGPASAGAPYSCTTSSFTGGCPASGNYTDPAIYSVPSGNASVRNQIWGPVPGETSTMSANGLQDWQDIINVPAGNTSVTGWPDSQVTLTDGNNTPLPLAGFTAMTSTLNLTSQNVPGAAYDNGWDVWGGVAGNSSTDYQYEMMIWTNQANRGTCGGATVLAQGVTFGSNTFTLCWYGSDTSEFVWYLSDASGNPVNQVSSSVDIYAMLQWMISHGHYPSTYGLNQVTVGSEVCSTGGNNQAVTLTGWTLSATTGSGGQLAPSAVTDAASAVTSTSATLNGTINPEGASTTYKFDYGTTAGYGSSTTAGNGGAGTTQEAESAALTGLAANTTYHYRVEAANSAGTTLGSDKTFTTQTAGGGTVLSDQGFEDGTLADYADWFGETATNSTDTAHSGTHSLKIVSTGSNWGIQENFPGTAVTPGQATSFSGWMKNSAVTDTGTVVTVNWLQNNNNILGTQTIAAADNAAGWTQWGGTFTPPAGTTSAFFQIADPDGGTHYLDDVEVVQGGTSFGGQQGPAVTTTAASGVASTGATLNGSVNPEGASTTYKFDYGTTLSYGSSTTTASAGSGTTAVAENAALTGLTANTTYHYRVEAANSGGTSYGADQQFTTTAAGTAPAVTTTAATGVSSSAATLNGTVNPEGAATTYQFKYGTTTGYGSVAPSAPGSAGSGTTAVSESAAVTGLTASTAYHDQLCATNSTGTTCGADQQFTTTAAGATAAYDATGPSSAGAKCANCASLSWTHTVGSAGTNRALLAGVAIGDSSDSGCTVTVKDGTTVLTKLAGPVHSNGQSAGFESVYYLVNPPAGANAMSLTVSGCAGGTPKELTAGSESFTGVSQSAPFGTPVTATGTGTAAQATVPSTTGNMIAAFAANGSPVTSVGAPATSRFIANQDSNSAAGNSAGSTAPATGSGVVMKWTVNSDWWAVIGVQVQHA